MESHLSRDQNSKPSNLTPDPFDMVRQFGAASTDMMSAWSGAWGAMLQNRGAPVGEALMKSFAVPAAWPTALVPVLDEIRSALKLPAFSDFPGSGMFALPSPAPLLGLMQVSQEFARISLPIWIKTCERFLAEAQKRQKAENGNGVDADSLLDIWNNVLDLTLMEFNRSGEFAKAQQWLLHAASEHRRELGGAVEKLAKLVDMPTRTEMTDVYRRLHDLSREVHTLRKELRELRRKPEAKPEA
jgi:hypothetical protein